MEKKMKRQRLRHPHRSGVRIALAIAALPVVLATGSSRAQDIYAYPAKGQTQSQQDRDRYECHSWAVKQTGFDPSRAQAAASDTHAVPNQPPPPQGHVVKGAARGAALGAVGGAITGNAAPEPPRARRWADWPAECAGAIKGSSRISSKRPLLSPRPIRSKANATPIIERWRRA
jgi:hypothetical protein